MGRTPEEIRIFIRDRAKELETAKRDLGDSNSYSALACEEIFYALDKSNDLALKSLWEEVATRYPLAG
ncbi:MAG TPA: hypothetical protein VGO21_05325 [Candidatus Paceibacterota bacterium]|nr:hypothetical protein [Candidatus Paceibacterota bacterium]